MSRETRKARHARIALHRAREAYVSAKYARKQKPSLILAIQCDGAYARYVAAWRRYVRRAFPKHERPKLAEGHMLR